MKRENSSQRAEMKSLVWMVVLQLLAVVFLIPSNTAAQTVITLVPSSYVTTAGGSGGELVATSIDLLDESGYNPVAGKYVDFWGATAGVNYAGYRVYTLPTSIAPSSITALQVKVNYQGPNHAKQLWSWQIFNWVTNSYVAIGDNSAVTQSWYQWQILTFNAAGTLAKYVRSSDGQIRVQLLSNNHADDTYIDYEAVIVTGSSGPPPVAVSISPTSATLNGGGTQQFTATVTGTTNTAVTWSLTGVGTMSTSGLYLPPATVATQTTVTVKATSQADTTKSASATVTLNPVVVSISPTSASVQTGKTQQFTATVTGSSNTTVNWQVNGVAGGNSTTGTVSASGLYTAPSAVTNPVTVTVTAVSQADTNKSTSATVTVTAQAVGIPLPIHGVTVEDTNDVTIQPFQSQAITALSSLSKKPTTRIVFTSPRPASDYQTATANIKAVSYVMGLPADSSYVKGLTVAAYLTRFQDYVTTLGNNVDIWEVCNECNGDWLGTTSDVVAKMTEAYDYVHGQGKVTALTLYQFPDLSSSCVSNPSYDMLTWAQNNVSTRMQQGLDYVLVSYYNDSCSPSQPEPDWQTLFQNLSAMFPNAKVGFGEVGWSTKNPPSIAARTNLINHFYGLHKSFPITVPNYVDGYFYWEFSIDMVPNTKQLWPVINTAMANQ